MSAILVKIPPAIRSAAAPERFANRESDKAGTGVISRDEQKNTQHDEQFDRDQQHADAHAGLQRNGKAWVRFAAQSCKCRPRVRECIHANPEPRHTVAACDANQAEPQDDGQGYRNISHRRQPAEVHRDNDRNESPEQNNELALRDEIRLARLIDQFGNFAHRTMNRQVLQLHIDRQAEQQPADAKQQSDHQQGVPVNAEKIHARQIRQCQVGFSSAPLLLRTGKGRKQQAQNSRHGFVRTLQKYPGANLDGCGDLLHFKSTNLRADDKPREVESCDERTCAHEQREIHPILCHKSSELEVLVRNADGSGATRPRLTGESHGKAIIRTQHCRVIAVTGFPTRLLIQEWTDLGACGGLRPPFGRIEYLSRRVAGRLFSPRLVRAPGRKKTDATLRLQEG